MNMPVDPAPVAAAQKLPAPPRKRRLWRWIGFALLCVAALVGFQLYEKTEQATVATQQSAGAPPQTVRTAAAAKGDIPIVLDALGTVTPLATITVKTQVSGALQQVGFAEGQLVKAGDFLAQIDPRPFQATLAQAQAQLAKDTALLAQAQADLGRYQTLSRQDSIAHQQVDDQVYLVAQDKAAMASDQAQIDAANLNIGYAHITAPISGRVGFRVVDPGNYVQPSDASGLVVLTQLQPITVFFSIPEDNLPKVSERLASGAKLSVALYDRANVKKLAEGELTTIDNQIDTTTGTVKLRATFANDDFALVPNQFVNVRLLVDTLANVVVAPNAAIQLGSIGNFVYVARDDSTVTVRKVTIGAADSDKTAILSGLDAGDNVVIDGVDRLREGAKVQVRNAAPAANGAATAGASGTGQKQRRSKNAAGAAQGAAGDAAGPPPGAPPP